MKKYIREGLGEDIEKFLEWFLSQNEYDNVSKSNGLISAWKIKDESENVIVTGTLGILTSDADIRFNKLNWTENTVISLTNFLSSIKDNV